MALEIKPISKKSLAAAVFEQLRDQIVSSRRLGSPGYCLFAYSNFFSSTSHESKAGNSAERLRRQMRETLRSLNRT